MTKWSFQGTNFPGVFHVILLRWSEYSTYWWISLKSNDYYWPEACGPGINPLSLRAGPVVLLPALSSLAWKGTTFSSTVTGQAFGAVQDVSCKWSFSILIPTVKAFTQFTFLIEISKFNSVEFVLLLSLCTTCLC